jgi:hypothetical protein
MNIKMIAIKTFNSIINYLIFTDCHSASVKESKERKQTLGKKSSFVQSNLENYKLDPLLNM